MQVRDWIHVADHNRAIFAVLEKGNLGEVYNIGSDNEQYNINITKMILKYLGKDESSIQYVTDRPGHDRRYAIDATKIKTQLGCRPQIDFATGLAGTIQWYLDNKKWWSEIKTGKYLEYYKLQYSDRNKG
jgi:dTDP-glucose 4,6-dehydratase